MTEDAAALDLLPLLFFTALIVYVLAMGSVDLARTIIRATALASVAFCLLIWGLAAFAYDTWGGPVVDDFYATAVLLGHLDARQGGWALIGLALLTVAFAGRALWRNRSARQEERGNRERGSRDRGDGKPRRQPD